MPSRGLHTTARGTHLPSCPPLDSCRGHLDTPPPPPRGHNRTNQHHGRAPIQSSHTVRAIETGALHEHPTRSLLIAQLSMQPLIKPCEPFARNNQLVKDQRCHVELLSLHETPHWLPFSALLQQATLHMHLKQAARTLLAGIWNGAG